MLHNGTYIILDGIWVCIGTFYYNMTHNPGIYAEGYIVFAFPLVCSFVCHLRNLRQSFSQSCMKVFQVGYISQTTHQKAFIFGP